MNRDLRDQRSREEAALAYPWPGNVRELRNRVERAVALATGDWIMPHDLFPAGAHGAASVQRIPTLEEARLAAEKRLILRALGDRRRDHPIGPDARDLEDDDVGEDAALRDRRAAGLAHRAEKWTRLSAPNDALLRVRASDGSQSGVHFGPML